MSELIQKNDDRATIHWKLLTGASVLALTAYISSGAAVKAEDTSQPQIWIELGGQLEAQTGQGHVFVPDFIANNPDSPAFNPVSPLHYERPPLYAFGEDGKITFQPDNTDWEFSASLRYGRSGGRKNAVPGKEVEHHLQYTRPPGFTYYHAITSPPKKGSFDYAADLFAPVESDQKQTHTIVDFAAGKDVGLGLFGQGGSSTLSAGARFAQFASNTSTKIHARPDTEFGYHSFGNFVHNFLHAYPSLPFLFPTAPQFHTYAAQFQAQRQFHGIGPSISWDASLPVAGNPNDGAITIDWGINAALLFGRQHSSGSHHTSGHFKTGYGTPSSYTTGKPFDRSRRVTVPNLGGMLGMSVKFPNAKISIGYRGDFFFGAMDTGVNTRRTGTTGFYGPFATISFGLGD